MNTPDTDNRPENNRPENNRPETRQPDTPFARRDFLGLAALGAGALAGLSAAAQGASVRVPAGRKSILHHRFGLNYVPSRKWYYAYNDWDAASIRRDMADIAELGADHIRAMVVWPWFQPNPRQVSNLHLDRLDGLMEAAAAVGIDVQPCIYTGWLSGWRFNPAFYHDEPFFHVAEVGGGPGALPEGAGRPHEPAWQFPRFRYRQ